MGGNKYLEVWSADAKIESVIEHVRRLNTHTPHKTTLPPTVKPFRVQNVTVGTFGVSGIVTALYLDGRKVDQDLNVLIREEWEGEESVS